MLLELKNAHAVLLGIVVASFKEFIYKFIEVYLYDWTMFILLKDHIQLIRLMLDRCH